MIIAISGKINSGKDTVGKIIQGLILGESKFQDGIIGFLESYEDYETYEPKDWKIKKFADKLKDIVCLLINCTREQLEDVNFKNKELREEWIKWQCYNFITKKKYKVFNSEEEADKYINEQPVKAHWKKSKVVLTPRLLLQLLGTECGRNIIHPNIWVNSLMSEYKAINYMHCLASEGLVSPVFSNWIITDTRFPNELKAIKDKGGISIRINRKYIDNENKIFKVDFEEHPSETALDNADFDYTIDNNGSIEDLIQKVKKILIKEKII